MPFQKGLCTIFSAALLALLAPVEVDRSADAAEELWLATPDRGLCASLYAVSQVSAKVGVGATVSVSEASDYPFSDTVTLKIRTPKAVKFPLRLRIPRWCAKPSVRVNGRKVALKAEPLSYAIIDRAWRDGDTLTLQL